MAMTVYYCYDYWGTSDDSLNTGQQYYTDPEYTNYAFTVESATSKFIVDTFDSFRTFFTISAGSVTPGITYYNDAFGIVLTVGVGNLSFFEVRNTTSETIVGLGDFVWAYDSQNLCYYESTSIGTFTPTDAGYTFSPTGVTTTQSPALCVYFTASEDSVYKNISGTISGSSSLSGTITLGVRIDPPSQTYWYDDGVGTSFYYRLIVQFDGSYGFPPPDGIEDIDYEILDGYLPNFINTNRRLVAATRNSIYYENI